MIGPTFNPWANYPSPEEMKQIKEDQASAIELLQLENIDEPIPVLLSVSSFSSDGDVKI